MVKSNSVVIWCAILVCAVLASAGLVGGVVPPATRFVPEGSKLTASQMASLFDPVQLYFNVSSEANPTGEIRGEITPSPGVYRTDAGNPFAANPDNDPVTFAALMGGDQVRARNVVTGGSGYGSVTIDPLTKQLTGFIVTSGIVGTAAHVKDGLPGKNGGIVVTLEGGPVVWTIPANTVLSNSQYARLSAGAYYFNVHSDAFPDGELRGQLNQQVRVAALTGSNEVPPVATAANGVGFLALDPVTRQVSGFVKADGFGSAVTSVALRLGDAATNGAFLFNLVNRGNGIWSVPFIDSPVLSAAAVTAFNSDLLYVNIRTQTNTAGEIRGQFRAADVKIGTAILNGSKEVPPVSTPATGSGMLAWNSVTEQVCGSVKTDGIVATAATLHSGPVSTTGPVLIALTATSPVTVPPTPGISFGLDIQPIFTASCARAPFCHVTGGNTPMSLQSGVSWANIINIVVPGDAASSYFFQRITVDNPPSFPRMPLNRPALSTASQNLVRDWIDNGALFDFYPVGVNLAVNPASPQATGTPVTFTADAQWGTETYDYQFWFWNGNSWTLARDYGPAADWIMPGTTLPGLYTVQANVRSAGSTVEKEVSARVSNYRITAPLAASVSLAASPTNSQTAGNPVTFSATGPAPTGYEYEFWLWRDSGWSLVQPYGTAATWQMPAATPVGACTIQVNIRSAGSTVEKDASARVVNYLVTAPVAASVDLSASPPNFQVAGNPVTFTAVGPAPTGYEFEFWLWNGSGWSLAKSYSPSAAWQMPDTTPGGTYTIQVNIRSAGSMVEKDAFTRVVNYQVLP